MGPRLGTPEIEGLRRGCADAGPSGVSAQGAGSGQGAHPRGAAVGGGGRPGRGRRLRPRREGVRATPRLCLTVPRRLDRAGVTGGHAGGHSQLRGAEGMTGPGTGWTLQVQGAPIPSVRTWPCMAGPGGLPHVQTQSEPIPSSCLFSTREPLAIMGVAGTQRRPVPAVCTGQSSVLQELTRG